MRDYSFGNFLHELRLRRGLTQYQLGALVGVSDKAVSKWENGSSKPNSRILYRLSEILGISVDELLSCKIRSDEERDKKGIFAMKKELWNRAYENMRKRYGERLPVEILNRFLSEKEAMEGTDMIVYLNLIAMITKEAEKYGEYIRHIGRNNTSFVEFLLGADEVDPLKPHYYCPECRKVEFNGSVRDGWDLPIRKCSCGTEMVRDGHDIPFIAGHYSHGGHTFFSLTVSPGFFEKAKEVVLTYFRNRKVLRLVRSDIPQRITFVLAPEDEGTPDGEELLYEEYMTDRLMKYPRLSLHAIQKFGLHKKLAEATGTSFRRIPFLQEDVLRGFCDGDTDVIPEFDTEIVKNMIHTIRPECFHDIIQIMGLSHGSGTWWNNGENLIRDGVPAGELIAYQDDVFNRIQKKLAEKQISDTGFAYKIARDAERGLLAKNGVSDEMKEQLRSIGMADWFADSVGRIKYCFPKAHGILYVKTAAVLMWYKIHYPKEFEEIYLEVR